MTFDGAHREFNPNAEYVRDWRGNSYRLYEPLGKTCDMHGCESEAVRHICPSHPERRGMTHWHGGMHSPKGIGPSDTGEGLWQFCRQHGIEALQRIGAMR